MFSMTGFGRGEYCENGLEISIELKSVNNRFLDVAIKCPHALSSFEEPIRARIRSEISRGHIDVFLTLLDKREKGKELYLDLSAAKAYVEAGKRLKETFPELLSDLSLSYLLKLPDVVKQEEPKEEEDLLPALLKALSSALSNLKEMRRSEGERLKKDLLERLRSIGSLREKIALRAPLVSEEYREKLKERIEEYLQGKVDETRILTEAAIYADKCNIDEELTRLSSHISQFEKIIEEDVVGRKLDFLVQEFNRECNTICSKSNDALLTGYALEMKNEIEKIREQIQNLE